MSTARRLLRAVGAAASPEARATDLDGTNDYLSRASDFTGNADGKTFTFSAWVYLDSEGTNNAYLYNTAGLVCYLSNNSVQFSGRNAASTLIFSTNSVSIPSDTWTHLLMSVDLTSAALRWFYVDDVNRTSDLAWSPYTNDTLNTTNALHSVGANTGGGDKTFGRNADVFLDYTYRDLSIEANRRLFTTIDPALGLVPVAPSALGAMSPIMTAFTNPDDLTENLGTGGAWTQNGVMARSNRGPNQFNAVASEFDGGSDWLHVQGLTGRSNASGMTISLNVLAGTNTVASDVVYTMREVGNGNLIILLRT